MNTHIKLALIIGSFFYIGLINLYAAENEQRLVVESLSAQNPIYFTVFIKTSEGNWSKKTTVSIPESRAFVELKPKDKDSLFFAPNLVALVDDGKRQEILLQPNQVPFLVFSRFRQSLDIDVKDYDASVKNGIITQVDLTTIKSGELFVDVLTEPGFEYELYPSLTAKKMAASTVQIFQDNKTRHPGDIEIYNRTKNPLFAAAYQCFMEVGDVTQNKNCTRISNILKVRPNSNSPLKDIAYDVRTTAYIGKPNSFSAYILLSRMEDDLTATRDLRESAMRQVVRSTRYAYNASYDIIKNRTTKKIWAYDTLNGIYISDSYLDFSRITKALQDAAVGLASWVSFGEYEKWAKPFKNIINEIAYDKNRFVDSSVRQEDALPKDEEEFLQNRRKETDKAFLKLGIDAGNFPVVATCMSGGGHRAMLSSLGFAMGLSDIGVLDAVTYQAGLSGSSWYLSKYMVMAAEAEKNGANQLINFNKFRSDMIERAQNIRHPNFKQHVQIAYMLAPLFKKFVYYQPITPVDLYGTLLGSTLLDLGSPNYINHTFSSFAKVTKSGAVPMPIGTAITKTNAHWMEITPFETGSSELSAYIPSFSLGRTYRKGIAIDNAPELTLPNTMAIMGSAFALQGFDFLRHVGPSLNFMPAGLEENLTKVINLSNNAGLLTLADTFGKNTVGVSFGQLINNLGKAEQTIGYWQQIYDSMPYGFVFIAKPEVGKDGRGWQAQSAIPAGIIPNPFYMLHEAKAGDEIFGERYTELRDAGIDFNLPFPPLLREERKINVIIAFDASGDILQNGAASLRLAEDYAKKHNLNFPSITDEDFKEASSKNIAVIGDPDDQSSLTIIYLSLLKNENLAGKLGQYSPLEDPFTATFNFSYPKESSSKLIDSVRENVRFNKDKIIDVLRRKSGLKSNVDDQGVQR